MKGMWGEISQSSWVLLQPVDDHDEAMLPQEVAMLQTLCPEVPFALLPLRVDWFHGLSPWSAPAAFKGQPDFTGGAAETLQAILDTVVPELRDAAPPTARLLLGGYSLAGLFALWAATQTDAFAGIAAVSPSVWFPGWTDFAKAHPLKADAVYLSLGDREERTRNPVMRTVGDCIRTQHELLLTQPVQTTLVWNPGNHFMDADSRTAAGFDWLMKNA